MMNHILLEIFCLADIDEKASLQHPICCNSESNIPSYHCLVNQCPYLDYTYCENTLCYINENAEMEEGISFGGEMEKGHGKDISLERWKNLSIEAIAHAYEKYMNR